MQRQSSKADHTLNAPLKTLPAEYGPHAVQKATAQLFTQIYKAAKNEDSARLKQIRNSYILLNNEECFSVIWNGYTPLTKLIKEGNLPASAFLYNRHRQPIMKTEVCLVTTKAFQTQLFNEPTKRYVPETIQQHIHCIEILLPDLTYTNKESLDKHFAELMTRVKLDKHFLSACSSALSGDDDKLRHFFSSNWLLTCSNPGVLKGCIAYLIGKYRPSSVIEEIWPGDDDTREWLLKGIFAGGHSNNINQSIKFLDKKNMPDKLVFATLQQMLANPQHMLSTIYHPTILQSLLACIDRDDLRHAMAKFLHLFQDEFTYDVNAHNELSQILVNATKLNRCMHIYHLDYEQALLFTQPSIYIWLMQSTQLLPRTSVIKIASLLTGVRDEALMQLQFKTHLRFLKDDLDHYLNDEHKANHAKRALSFKQACSTLNSLTDLKILVNRQIGLFKDTVQNPKSKLKHEKPYGKKGRDKFIDILKKNQTRMQK